MPVDVSVVIPCRNEASFIDGCLETLTRQNISDSVEFLIAEGCSDDGTREKLVAWQQRDSRIRIIDNPGRFVSSGLNRAIRAANGEIIVRADVHTKYSENYVDACVKALRETGADNVGGPWRAKGVGWLQRAIAAAFQSPFSSGGARSHSLDYEGPVDSVYLGCWYKTKLLEIGLFDEELVRNQDDELNLRINRGGGLVWQVPKIYSEYIPRPSLRRLFRQYFQYGYWKIRVLQKHGRPASIRHLAPASSLILMFAISIAAVFYSRAVLVLAAALLIYALASILASLRAAHMAGDWRVLPILPFVFLLFHLGYAAGSLNGIFDFLLLRKKVSNRMARLTR